MSNFQTRQSITKIRIVNFLLREFLPHNLFETSLFASFVLKPNLKIECDSFQIRFLNGPERYFKMGGNPRKMNEKSQKYK